MDEGKIWYFVVKMPELFVNFFYDCFSRFLLLWWNFGEFSAIEIDEVIFLVSRFWTIMMAFISNFWIKIFWLFSTLFLYLYFLIMLFLNSYYYLTFFAENLWILKLIFDLEIEVYWNFEALRIDLWLLVHKN